MPKLPRYYGSLLKGKVEKQLTNKKSNPSSSANVKFLLPKTFLRGSYVVEFFFEDMGLLIVKNH
jgi:hypothetical protein